MESAKQNDKPSIEFSHKIASYLLQLSNDTYSQCLKDHISHFTMKKSTKWDIQFKKYQSNLLADARKWATLETSKEESGWSAEEIKSLKILSSKLKAVLKHYAMSGYPFIPHLESNIPILCPNFLFDLHEEISTYSPLLSLVSFFFSQVNDCLCYGPRSRVGLSQASPIIWA